jgi:hypothetical protein
MSHDHRSLLRTTGTYLRVRRSWWLFALMLAIGIGVMGWGTFEVPTPAATESGGTAVQLWRLLAVAAAALPALTLASPMETLEAAAGPPYHRLRSAVLAGAFVLSSFCIITGAAIGVHPAVIPLIARALLAWFGLALISGRVLGWNHAWILPCAAMAVLLYWGHTGNADHQWWEFTAQPADHLESLLLACGLFAGGLVAYVLSPWRINRITMHRHHQTRTFAPNPQNTRP